MPDFTSLDPRCLSPEVLKLARSIEKDWRVDCQLSDIIAAILTEVDHETLRSPHVISGYRTRAEQAELKRRGRPTAPDDLSNHRVLPSRAVDVSLGAVPSKDMKWALGRAIQRWGLRWGGGSKLDESDIPTDWQHIDFGPRPPGIVSGP